MGGSGSTRWGLHNKKTQVEDCRKLTIYSFKPYLQADYQGSVRWRLGDRETGSIGYRVVGGESPDGIQLNYTITGRHTGKKADYDYFIRLQTTPLPWGGVRYWFTCPLVINNRSCRRRVGVLYLPPGGRYFGCRYCYNLTYRSCQESGQFDTLYASLANSLRSEYPGITGRDVSYLFEHEFTDHMEELAIERYLREWEPLLDRYANYLTVEELCQQSGLSAEVVSRLQEIRLLVQDTSDGRYRPKLVSWACKLNYLLNDGWELEQIKRWARGRWNMQDPRQWPPDRDQWNISMEVKTPPENN